MRLGRVAERGRVVGAEAGERAVVLGGGVALAPAPPVFARVVATHSAAAVIGMIPASRVAIAAVGPANTAAASAHTP